MLSFAARTAPAVALALMLLSSCSSGNDNQQSPAPEQLPREFSEEDKIAARALSLGNSSAIRTADSPYAGAVLCSQAIESIAERFGETDGISNEQVQALQQAKAVYDRRARALANSAGAQAGGSGSDPRAADSREDDAGSMARVALACLQDLL